VQLIKREMAIVDRFVFFAQGLHRIGSSFNLFSIFLS
jgi:hypothetical protein